MTILGKYYYATTIDGHLWNIFRGRFLMSQFLGDMEEVTTELKAWDETVVEQSP